jgi:hypothetical protein
VRGVVVIKIVRQGDKYAVRKVNNKCYQLIKIIEEFSSAEEAQAALTKLQQREMLEIRIANFSLVWKDILHALNEDKVIETLTSKKIYAVEQVVPEGLLVNTDQNSPELVKKEWIKSAWETLVNKGAVMAEDISGAARYRSSFIIALLAGLDYVRAETNPNKLSVKFD